MHTDALMSPLDLSRSEAVVHDFDEFLTHMNSADAMFTRAAGPGGQIGIWMCNYAGKPDVLAGRWDREAKIGVLELI